MHELVTDRPEKAILVGPIIPPDTPETIGDSLDELERLTDTLGAEVVGRLVQERGRIDPATYIGSGKTDELARAAVALDADLVVFDVDLSPAQTRNLEKSVGRARILDRSGLILEIFGRHARSREARTQVELARWRYLLPRLAGRWRHLPRQVGGIGVRGGEGETQIEIDRRLVKRRIARLEEELEKIARRRKTRSEGRRGSLRVALIGYTNAGKSSLLNAFTEAGVLVEDRLFSTLDSTIRAFPGDSGERILLIDTVGFLRKLPHSLVASFRSTLEEAVDADLLLHVVDVTHPRLEDHMAATRAVLEELGIADKPALVVFNKADALPPGGNGAVARLHALYPGAVFVSARTGQGLESLRDRIVEALHAGFVDTELTYPAGRARLTAELYRTTEVLEAVYQDGHVTVRFRARPAEVARLRRLADGAEPS